MLMRTLMAAMLLLGIFAVQTNSNTGINPDPDCWPSCTDNAR